MPRRNKQWYLDNNKPLPESFERKTYNWYLQRGLTPPKHLSKPKKIWDGNISAIPTQLMSGEVEQVIVETEEQIESRIKTRFQVLEALVQDVVEGDVRALIVSGPPGLGKSFTVETALEGVENCRIVKGHASAKGLYETLFAYKEEGSILVFDDADSIFGDERGLNLLKTALDTTEERVISWITGGPFGSSGADGDEDAGGIPSSFVFEGSIIFITNLDFDHMIARANSKVAKHIEALVSRAHYIDLMMKNTKDFVVRIKQVARETKMLSDLTKPQVNDVIKFIEDNQRSLREISLRTALKVAALRKGNKDNWMDVAKITCCKVGEWK